MAVVLADVIDDVEFALCTGCSGPFVIRDGWEGSCPACCAVVDDHDAGRHEFVAVTGCHACDVVDDRLDLSAIA